MITRYIADYIHAHNAMTVAIEIAHESRSTIVNIGDRRPEIGWCAIEFKVLIQHIIVKDNVVNQLVVLAFGYTWILIGNLGKISQLLTVRDEVRIILRSCSTSK